MCGEHSPCSGHTGFAPYRSVCAFPVYTAQAPGCSVWSGPCVECSSSFRVLHKSADSVAPACCVFPGLSGSGSQRLARALPGAARLFPPQRAAQAARGLGALSPGAAGLFPPWPQRALPVGSQEVFRQELGRFAVWEGAASLGLSLLLSPPPCLLPLAGMGRLFSGVSQSLCFANRTTGSVFWPVNFSLLSHSLKELPLTALRAFGPVLTLSNASRSSLFHPHLLVAGAGVWVTFLLGVAFRHVICGPYLIFPPS